MTVRLACRVAWLQCFNGRDLGVRVHFRLVMYRPLPTDTVEKGGAGWEDLRSGPNHSAEGGKGRHNPFELI